MCIRDSDKTFDYYAKNVCFEDISKYLEKAVEKTTEKVEKAVEKTTEKVAEKAAEVKDLSLIHISRKYQ